MIFESSANPIYIARALIKKETDALSNLSLAIDQSFIEVMTKILTVRGRLILTGVGKSSHIARKISSTFASTGTPAFFVHPAEASHGDLGMITADDMVIVLSRSGESAELKDIVQFCKQFSIPLVGITACKESTLAKAANFNLFLPDVEEACTLGLAPTTSSIMMLALGDALAVACLEKRKFTKDDFKIFHPAGKLGLSLLKVADIMHSGDETPLVNLSHSLSDTILEMTRCRFGCVGVIDSSGHLVGIFTDGDLRRSLGSVELTQPISSLMVKNPASLDPNAFLVDAAQTFRNRRIPSAFICEAGKPIGILHIHDLLQRGFV
jgi:arabinose-5-phosphate isomerase